MINQQQQQKENTLKQDNAVVAIYPTHTAAEAAAKELQQSGFDMKKLSIKNDKFVLIVHGSTDDTTHAQAILDRTQPETLEHLRSPTMNH
jgi:ADP-heptose:LPS heptosyltransferase